MKIKWCPNCFSCYKDNETECPLCHIQPVNISLEPQLSESENNNKE